MGFFTKEVQRTDFYGNAITKPELRMGRIVLCIILAIVLIVGMLTSITMIKTGYTGVVTVFGKVQNYTLDEGLNFKAPWHKVIKMDNREQKETVELACFSSDIQEVNMVFSLNYQLDRENAMQIYRNVGKKYYDTLVAPCISESVKAVVAQYTAEELISSRTQLAAALEADLYEKLGARNIIVVSTSIEDMDFTDAFTNAVEEKQVAQQNKLKAETEAAQKVIEAEAEANVRKIEADAQAYETITKAEAQAEANNKLADSITDDILTKMYYEKWNGTLPKVVTDGNGSVIVNVPEN